MNKISFFAYLFRIPTFRLTAFYMLAFCVISVALTFYIAKNSNQFLIEGTKKFLCQESNNLLEAYQTDGLEGAKDYIAHQKTVKADFLYVINDRAGNLIASNMGSIDPAMLKQIGVIETPLPYKAENNGKSSYAVGCGSLQKNIHFFVGQDIEMDKHEIAFLEEASLVAMALVIIIGFLVWLLMAKTTLARIENITEAADQLMEGDLAQRLPISNYDDGFDLISKRLNLMLDRIEGLTNNLRHVSDNIAHDLKTPLTRLRNRLEYALLEKPNLAQYKQLLDNILAESESLIKIFDSILLISKLEYGSANFNLEPVNLRNLIVEAHELYEYEAEESKIDFIIQDLFDCDVFLQKELILQTLCNVINNAIKYGSSEGTQNAQIRLSMSQDSAYYYICIDDNGPGISDDDFDKVTERFVRLDRSRSQPGFGIGLSLAKATMLAHEGGLFFENLYPGLRVKLAFQKMAKLI